MISPNNGTAASQQAPAVWLHRLLPFLKWWPMVNRTTTKADLLAGLTGAVVVLPQGVAFATLAGLPPEYGLYCAMLPAIVAALFGSSWHLVSGPTNAISLVVFATISPLAVPGSPAYIGLVLTLTFLTGLFQLVMGFARLGALVNFISHTVIVGFTSGAALLIIGSQIRNFFGVKIPGDFVFLESIHHFLIHYNEINLYVTAVAVITLASAVVAKRYAPRLPYMIAAMVAGSLAALLLDLFFGNDRTQIATVGALTASLPSLSLPNFSLEALRQVVPIALAVSMLAITEALTISRAIAVKSGQRIDGNQEFIGQGLSNLAGSFFSGYASSGSFNRSGLNHEAGARTPLAAAFSALFLIAILFLVAPLAAYLPMPTMAAILFMVGFSLIDIHHIRSIATNSRSEATVFTVTFLATLLLPLEFAIYSGVLLSLMLFLDRNARPAVLSLVPDQADPLRKFIPADENNPACPQLKLVRVEGPLFFGAVDYTSESLLKICGDSAEKTRCLMIGKGINFVDMAGAEFLANEARMRRRDGGALYLYSLRRPVLELLRKGRYMESIGEENIFNSKGAAISAIYPTLNPDVCRTCTARIFRECNVAPPTGGNP